MSTYAVLKIGGREYRVSPGDLLYLEQVGGQAGFVMELGNVLLVSKEGQLKIGTPTIGGAKVLVEVREHLKGPKAVAFKYKAKTRFRRKTGHRQPMTRLLVKEIRLEGEEGGQ
ncbi:MAG: 50S ribosomal protein L21 [Chloroflexi bacterium]|nr:50S ribosomal protein L21 [Chloroflexota bacterium]